MAKIDRIVRVNISLRSKGVRQLTFSDLLLLAEHTNENRVNIITDPDEVLDGYGVDENSQLYAAVQTAFSQTPGPRIVLIGRRDPGETVTQSISECRNENDDWFGFADVTRSEANVLALADWAEANGKLFMAAIRTLSSTTLVQALALGNYSLTSFWYHPDPKEFPEIAIAASRFTISPGGDNWANVSLNGVSSLNLSETLSNAITTYNGNTFEQFRNLSITQNGTVANGERIDNVRFQLWLCEEIRTSVFLALINKDKIPMTDVGISIIKAAIFRALDLGVTRGGISLPEVDQISGKVVPSYTVTVPSALQISVADKAARILRDVKFTARLAGSINSVGIEGSLVLDAI